MQNVVGALCENIMIININAIIITIVVIILSWFLISFYLSLFILSLSFSLQQWKINKFIIIIISFISFIISCFTTVIISFLYSQMDYHGYHNQMTFKVLAMLAELLQQYLQHNSDTKGRIINWALHKWIKLWRYFDNLVSSERASPLLTQVTNLSTRTYLTC